MAKEKNKVGRPLAYKTPEELQARIEEYFKKKKKVSITGLALFLGFSSRKDLINYAERPEFLHTIKTAKTLIEKYYEEHLISKFSTGSIFALKNFDWTDKHEVEHGVTDEFSELLKEINGGKGVLPCDEKGTNQ